MPRSSNYRRSDFKPGKHTYHDLPQDLKIARETNRCWPPEKNISRIHKNRIIYPVFPPIPSTSPSTNSPNSKELERSMKIADRKTCLEKLANDHYNKEKEISPANLKEMIESSIKSAMLSVADQCRLRKKGKVGDTKMAKMESRKGRSKHKGFVRKEWDKESTCPRSRSVYAKSRDTKKQWQKSWKSVDRGKHSKNRSQSESTTGRITDNRRMTGNVNIFICSEATDGNQARNKSTDPRLSTESKEETSLFSTESTESSNLEVGESFTTLSSRIETGVTDQKVVTQNSPHYRQNNNTGSDSSSPTFPSNPADGHGKFNKSSKQGIKIAADKNEVKEPPESPQSLVNEDRPNARSFGRLCPGIDRSDLSFFSPRFIVRDNERPWTAAYPSRNVQNLAASEPPSLKSVCANVDTINSHRNQHNPDYRQHRDTPHKYCCSRDKKLVLDRTNKYPRLYCKRKVTPCPFLAPEKRPLLCTACNKCPVQENSWDFTENPEICCRHLRPRISANVCNKGDVNVKENVKEIEKLPEEHVTSIVEYAGDAGRVETGVIAEVEQKNLDHTKLRTNEERQIRSDNEAASTIDKLIDVKKAHSIEKDARTKVTGVDKQATEAPPIKNDQLEKEDNKLDETNDKLTDDVQVARESCEKNVQVQKKSESPLQPPKVESSANKSPARSQRLLKFARIVERHKAAKNPVKTNPEIPRATGRLSHRKVSQLKLSPIITQKAPQKGRLETTGTLKKDQEKSVGSRSKIRAQAMKESAKRFIRAKRGIPLKSSGSRGKRGDIRQNKQVQPRTGEGTKNMHSKQTVHGSGSQAVRPRSFKERMRDSLLCRTMMKVVNRLKCSKCRWRNQVDKNEKAEKSSEGNVLTEEDKQAGDVHKSNMNSQSRVRASRQDRRRVRSVVRKPVVSRPVDNKKHIATMGFPVKKQKTPEDKKDASNDVTVSDNLASVDRAIKGEKKEADPNSRRPAKPKLLTAITTKRISLSTNQKHPQPTPPRRIENEEKPQEPESKVDDEVSKDKTTKDSPIVRIEEEMKMMDDKAPTKDAESQERDFHTLKPKELSEANQAEELKVPRVPEKQESIVEPKMEMKPARVSDAAKDKIESESVQIRVPQSSAPKVDSVGIHAPVDSQAPSHTTDILKASEHEVKAYEDICDNSKCRHPKSCLKRPRKLSGAGHSREFQDCVCRMGNVYFAERKPRVDARCNCGGCHKREGNHRHERALNYGDTIARRERHRCRTLVCLYCDRPRDKCVCRNSPRLCACCKLSGDLCNCQDQETCYRHGISVPNEPIFSKLNKELRHFKRDSPNYGTSPGEECRYHAHHNKMNNSEYEMAKGKFCQVCGEVPCSCECLIKGGNRNKGQKNPRDIMNSVAQTLDSKMPIRCKCDYCLPTNDCKHHNYGVQQVKQSQRKSMCCYSESSVCT